MAGKSIINKSAGSAVYDVSAVCELDVRISNIVEKYREASLREKLAKSDFRVKYASIIFYFGNKWYRLCPEDIYASQELFEYFSHDIEDELAAAGACDVYYSGMPD